MRRPRLALFDFDGGVHDGNRRANSRATLSVPIDSGLMVFIL